MFLKHKAFVLEIYKSTWVLRWYLDIMYNFQKWLYYYIISHLPYFLDIEMHSSSKSMWISYLCRLDIMQTPLYSLNKCRGCVAVLIRSSNKTSVKCHNPENNIKSFCVNINRTFSKLFLPHEAVWCTAAQKIYHAEVWHPWFSQFLQNLTWCCCEACWLH